MTDSGRANSFDAVTGAISLGAPALGRPAARAAPGAAKGPAGRVLLAIGLVVLAVIAVGAFRSFTGNLVDERADAEVEAKIWLNLLFAGDAAGAYTKASPEFQATTPLETLNPMVDQLRSTGATVSFTSWEMGKGANTSGTVGNLEGTLAGIPGTTRVRLSLKKADGIWRVLGVQLDP